LKLAVDHHLDKNAQEFMHQLISSIPQRMDEGIPAQVFRSGKAVLLPFVSPEAFRAQEKSEFHPLLTRLNIHSVLIAPLRAEGKIIGTITISRDQTPYPYTEDDRIFLQDLADRATLAITNARLYAATQQLNNQLEQRVTERTAALSQANALLQTLLDHMPDHIYFKDSQSRFIRNSRSQAKALGLRDPAEAIGKSDFDFFPHAQLSYEREQEIIRSGKPLVNIEELVVWPDGRQTWVLTTKMPFLDQAGQIIGTFGISRDITKRKQSEVALQKAKLELEAANKELEAFSYSVSHDLRSPLRSIDGFSQALLEDYSDQLPVEGRDFLARIRSSAQRMAALIDDLLNLSRVTRAPFKLVPVDLTALAENILADLQRTHPERSVRCSIAPNLNARGDPQLLRIVLENLLNNSWKYSSKQGQAEIEVGSKYENNETIYFVRDNGAGFDMAYANKLFGAFQRLHTATEFPGTGIGLATVQRIIHRHGGRVWAEGAVNQGSTFFFTLPALEAARSKTAPTEVDSMIKRAREII
jgi:PAS domain S-box-containing protein